MAGSECIAPLVVAVMLTLLPRTSLTLGVALRAESEEGLNELSQAILQLTQRFATLELSLESRLSRLTDSATKGEALISSLSARLDKVDALVEKVDALDARLTHETSALRSTIDSTNRDLQDMSTRLERMDRMAEAAEAARLVDEREGGGGEGGREGAEEINSRHETRASSDLTTLSTLITRSVAEEVERSLTNLLDRSLSSFQNSLYKRLSKNVAQLQEEVRGAREELEHLGRQTLTTATGARQDIRQGEKTTQDAVTDIKNKIHSVHRDLALKISSSPSLSSLEPVLQQVNHSVVESIARAAEGLNVTLLDEAARRRGTTDGENSEERGRHRTSQQQHPREPAPHCPDPNTVTTLLEVKRLLQSLLRKSEDLRRGLTKQTSEGVDLLKLLHQRFSVLVRRMNTDPEYGQMLMAEMQDLNSLVESSYMAVMMAQTAFIDSCKRIQEEEPLLERKMTELLDKLVTNIDLGYEHNRQQLSELKEVVTRLGQRGTVSNATQEPARTRPEEVVQTLGDTANLPGLVQEVLFDAVEAANHTAERLEEVEGFVDDVTTNLLSVEWWDRRQKNAADQLVTAAKDLKGYAQEQIIQSLDLYSELLAVLEQFNASLSQGQAARPSPMPPLDLLGDAASIRLPATCTAALLQQVTDLQGSKTRIQANTPQQPYVHAAPDHPGQGAAGAGQEEEREEEEDVPDWYTDPVFLSGNYGTPDRGLPVFREEDWVDMDDDYDTEPAAPTASTPTASPATPPLPVTAPPRPATRGFDRYFGTT